MSRELQGVVRDLARLVVKITTTALASRRGMEKLECTNEFIEELDSIDKRLESILEGLDGGKELVVVTVKLMDVTRILRALAYAVSCITLLDSCGKQSIVGTSQNTEAKTNPENPRE